MDRGVRLRLCGLVVVHAFVVAHRRIVATVGVRCRQDDGLRHSELAFWEGRAPMVVVVVVAHVSERQRRTSRALASVSASFASSSVYVCKRFCV